MRTEVDKVVEVAESFWDELKEAKESMDEWSEWNSPMKALNNLQTLTSLIGSAMLCVEKAVIATGTILSSAEKRKAAAKLLDDKIQVPGMLELFDGPAFEYALTWVAALWNRQVGHKWPLQ
jgi:hypothetical protein